MSSENPPPGHKQSGPYIFQAAAGVKYAYCRCGKSARYPMCDGAHRAIGDGTEVTPIKVIPEESTTFVWCACGKSEKQPDCDGHHARF